VFLAPSSSDLGVPYRKPTTPGYLSVGLVVKHRQLASQVGDLADNPSSNSMASFNSTCVVTKAGMSFVFSSWVLANPKNPEVPATKEDRSVECFINNLNTAPFSTSPKRLDEETASSTISNQAARPAVPAASGEKYLELSDLIGNYAIELRSIRHPRVVNAELLDRVDHVSRNIIGCIELAESTLQQHNKMTHRTPERPSPRLDRMGDTFSGIDRVDSSLINRIKLSKSAIQPKIHKNQGGAGPTSKTHLKLKKTNPQLHCTSDISSEINRDSPPNYTKTEETTR
jgi:hypothetical protein